MERTLPAGWGDDAASWTAAIPPTPGIAGEPVPTFNLTVVSAHGSPVPSVGVHAIATNTALSNSVPSPSISSGTRYLCTGWTLAGNEPASGTTNWMNMTLTNDATLTWLWETNFALSIATDPGGSVSPGSDWQIPGAIVELVAAASNDFVFAGWTGDTNALVSGTPTSAVISVQLNAPVALTAHFDAIVPTYYASPSGSHTPPFTNWAMASTSLAAIVSYVPSGSTVLLAAATFSLPDTLTIDKALHIQGSDSPSATLLDGGNAARVLLLSHSDAVVEGVTIQNGNSGSSSGGGVRIDPDGQLIRCILRDNQTQRSGGGVAMLGGGILRGCLLYDNSADSENGGGIHTYTTSQSLLIDSCTLSGNSANTGGGININGDTILLNSIVWGNSAGTGSNILVNAAADIQHTLSGPAQSGPANLGSNPLFLDAPSDEYHLATNSPALNAGTNLSWMATADDLDGAPRLLYGTNDLGAFEILLPATDSDGDGCGDWQEFLAGTDPFNLDSVLDILSIGPDAEDGHFAMSWSSTTGRVYRITYTTNLALPFTHIAYSNISAEPPTNSFSGPLPHEGPGFYRVELDN